MKKLFLLLSVLSLAFAPVRADEEIDQSFVFMDEEGAILENGVTITRNVVEVDPVLGEVIKSGIYVLNMTGSTDYLKVKYTIEKIDNGTYQICFPSNCNMKTTTGSFETGIGQLASDLQDIQSEWFPQADGECIVTLKLELMTKKSGFPPTYNHKAWGPSLTLKFVKGQTGPDPIYGDVNGDGEVSISDVNSVIDFILNPQGEIGGADVDGDGEVNINDVNIVIDVILKQ